MSDAVAMLKEARRIAADHSVSMREKKRAENRRADGEMGMSSDDEIRERYMSGLWDSDASVQCALTALRSPVPREREALERIAAMTDTDADFDGAQARRIAQDALAGRAEGIVKPEVQP